MLHLLLCTRTDSETVLRLSVLLTYPPYPPLQGALLEKEDVSGRMKEFGGALGIPEGLKKLSRWVKGESNHLPSETEGLRTVLQDSEKVRHARISVCPTVLLYACTHTSRLTLP